MLMLQKSIFIYIIIIPATNIGNSFFFILNAYFPAYDKLDAIIVKNAIYIYIAYFLFTSKLRNT